MSLLEIRNLNYYYGNIRALQNVNLLVNDAEIVTIIGSNGAGKSTTLKSISGLLNIKGKEGNIFFGGEDITKLSGNEITKKGISQVLEGRHIFSQLSVEENLLMGTFLRRDNKIKEDVENIYKRFPRLKERKKQLGGTLSGGEQQMLAIARALLAKPKLLLLDEPSLGLAPIIVKEIFEIIKDIKEKDGITILLVEQNTKAALAISDRGYVMQNGYIILEGKSHDLLNNKKIKQAYLGEANK